MSEDRAALYEPRLQALDNDPDTAVESAVRRLQVDPAPISDPAPGDDGVAPVTLEITEFAGDVVHGWEWAIPNGVGQPKRFHPRELVGLHWSTPTCAGEDCETVSYRIAGVSRDTATNTMPSHSDNSDVWLYQVEYSVASSLPQWRNLCGEGEPEETGGIFVNGRWPADGTWQPDGWTFSCRTGVVSKCVRSWGYKPWKTLTAPSGETVDLRPLHLACTRAARADYCGDGIPHTRDGTLVDMFDAYGLNEQEDGPGFNPESAFGASGALWVERPRWPAGTPTGTGWRFEGCELPRSEPEAEALVYVWSDPRNGRVR